MARRLCNFSLKHPASRVPGQLTMLESLAIYNPCRDGSRYPICWNHISSSTQRLLLTLVHLPTVSHLDLRWIDNFPISNPITCTNIKHLSVTALNDITYEHDQAASSLSRQPIHLQAIDISLWSSDALHLLAAKRLDGRPMLDFTGLVKICVRFHWIDAAVPIRKIFRKTQRLTDIALEVTDTDFRAMEFAKTVMPSLQTLQRLEEIS